MKYKEKFVIEPVPCMIGKKDVSCYVDFINEFRYEDRYNAAIKLQSILNNTIQPHYIYQTLGLDCVEWNGKDVTADVKVSRLVEKDLYLIPYVKKSLWTDMGYGDKGIVVVTIGGFPVFLVKLDRHDGFMLTLREHVVNRAIEIGTIIKPLK